MDRVAPVTDYDRLQVQSNPVRRNTGDFQLSKRAAWDYDPAGTIGYVLSHDAGVNMAEGCVAGIDGLICTNLDDCSRRYRSDRRMPQSGAGNREGRDEDWLAKNHWLISPHWDDDLSEIVP